MNLKELDPAVFFLYMDNPVLLDILGNSAIELEGRRLLTPTLAELANSGEYNQLDCELDRFGLWLVRFKLVSVADTMRRPAIPRETNPLAKTNPSTLSDLLRGVEAGMLKSDQGGHSDSTRAVLLDYYQTLLPLFNKTLLQ